MTLSIDLGHTYLAFAYVREFTVTYGLHNIPTALPQLTSEAFRDFVCAFDQVDRVIVERQVPRNTICMKLMHLLVGVCVGLGIDVHTVDAREKFRQLNVPYTTVGKAHKLLSTDLALKWIESSGVEDLSPTPLPDYDKQDDIADAINQLRGWIIEH
jgi:hypothetical protein